MGQFIIIHMNFIKKILKLVEAIAHIHPFNFGDIVKKNRQFIFPFSDNYCPGQ